MKIVIRKKPLAVILLIITLPFLISTKPKTSGGHPSSTGGPDEKTCAQSGCHTVDAVFSDDSTNTLIFPTSDSTYEPGKIYSISLEVKKTAITKFGFELVALEDTNNLSTGQLIVTDSSRTHLINGTINGKARKYITHSTDGTPALSTGYTSWSFDWEAPSTDMGSITFYFITNCTNDNGAASGDSFYQSSFTIKPKSSSSINDIFNERDLLITYSKSNHTIYLDYTLKKLSNLNIHIFDAQGKNLKNLDFNLKSAGRHSDQISLRENISWGVYTVNIQLGNQTVSRKILIE
jgi:hypothetical protein